MSESAVRALAEDPPPSSLTLETVINDDVSIILVRGEVDASTAPQLEAVIESVVADAGALELDLTGLNFLDSSGLGVLAMAIRSMEGQKGELTLSNVPPQVIRLLTLADLLRFMRIASTRES